jgi:hypothetical protein
VRVEGRYKVNDEERVVSREFGNSAQAISCIAGVSRDCHAIDIGSTNPIPWGSQIVAELTQAVREKF